MSARRRPTRRSRGRRGGGVVAVAAWLALLLGALSLVPWRQTRGVAMEASLRELEAERAIVEAERLDALRRIEELRSRARILRVARDRLGMHLPEDREIVFLPAPVPATPVLGSGR